MLKISKSQVVTWLGIVGSLMSAAASPEWLDIVSRQTAFWLMMVSTLITAVGRSIVDRPSEHPDA